jgi:hypothetical protein
VRIEQLGSLEVTNIQQELTAILKVVCLGAACR